MPYNRYNHHGTSLSEWIDERRGLHSPARLATGSRRVLDTFGERGYQVYANFRMMTSDVDATLARFAEPLMPGTEQDYLRTREAYARSGQHNLRVSDIENPVDALQFVANTLAPSAYTMIGGPLLGTGTKAIVSARSLSLGEVGTIGAASINALSVSLPTAAAMSRIAETRKLHGYEEDILKEFGLGAMVGIAETLGGKIVLSREGVLGASRMPLYEYTKDVLKRAAVEGATETFQENLESSSSTPVGYRNPLGDAFESFIGGALVGGTLTLARDAPVPFSRARQIGIYRRARENIEASTAQWMTTNEEIRSNTRPTAPLWGEDGRQIPTEVVDELMKTSEGRDQLVSMNYPQALAKIHEFRNKYKSLDDVKRNDDNTVNLESYLERVHFFDSQTAAEVAGVIRNPESTDSDIARYKNEIQQLQDINVNFGADSQAVAKAVNTAADLNGKKDADRVLKEANIDDIGAIYSIQDSQLTEDDTQVDILYNKHREAVDYLYNNRDVLKPIFKRQVEDFWNRINRDKGIRLTDEEKALMDEQRPGMSKRYEQLLEKGKKNSAEMERLVERWEVAKEVIKKRESDLIAKETTKTQVAIDRAEDEVGIFIDEEQRKLLVKGDLDSYITTLQSIAEGFRTRGGKGFADMAKKIEASVKKLKNESFRVRRALAGINSTISQDKQNLRSQAEPEIRGVISQIAETRREFSEIKRAVNFLYPQRGTAGENFREERIDKETEGVPESNMRQARAAAGAIFDKWARFHSTLQTGETADGFNEWNPEIVQVVKEFTTAYPEMVFVGELKTQGRLTEDEEIKMRRLYTKARRIERVEYDEAMKEFCNSKGK